MQLWLNLLLLGRSNMGGSSMMHSYFVQKDEDERNSYKKEPELELVFYKGELVVTERPVE